MSTNKTENLNLHNWESSDRFLRAELNENFSLLDASVASRATVVAGAYVGDGSATRTIELGFAPVAVLLMDENGALSAAGYSRGGLALPDHPVKESGSYSLAVCETGFQVFYSAHRTNNNNLTYHYLAFR